MTKLAMAGSGLNDREEMLVCVAWIPKATVQVRAYHSLCPVDLYFAVVAHITLISYLFIMFAT